MTIYQLERSHNIPITDETPLFNVQGVHTNIKEDKGLSNKRQGCKSMSVKNV